jgi:AcrR family transcriptional regulator
VRTKRERATPLAPEARRQAIVDAVVPLLAKHGGDVTTKQIAQAAGIAEGTIFRVFPDKRALFLAAAEEAISPQGGREAMAAALAAVPALRDKVVLVADQLKVRMEQGMLVMMALRSIFMKEGPGRHTHDGQPGPPAFLVEADRTLLDALAADVFGPHADELVVPPRRAALVLRSLVFGTWHPGAHDDERLTADEIADACLRGVKEDR